MWPPQSVKTCPTLACRSTRATSWPPVRSAMTPSFLASPEALPPPARSPPAETRKDVGREGLQLLALGPGIPDGIDDEVPAASLAEPLDVLGALLGGPDHAVLAGQGREVLRVAATEVLDPRRPRPRVVPADRHERQVGGRESLERALRRLRG